jgi:5-methylcytosine-specific restriction endonuclease McrA
MSLAKIGSIPVNKGKGTKTKQAKLLRNSKEFRQWRKAVFERDNWTCQTCFKRGGVLHPHHIKPFAFFPELRFSVANGQTLCESCHRLTETFGYRAKKLAVSCGYEKTR